MKVITAKFLSVILLIIVLSSSLTVSAWSPVKSYTYNSTGEAQEIPTPYDVDAKIGGENITLSSPQDMATYKDKIYVLDSGNSQIVVFDGQLNVVEIIKFIKDGKPYETIELMGIFVNGNGIYIADRNGGKVFRCDFNGNVINEYKKPKTDLLTEENLFLPLKVIVDSLDQIYILVENEYRGALTINKNGDFIGFFGSGNVKVTSEVLLRNFWRKFQTEAQLKNTEKTLSIEFKNFAIDENDFIYAVEASSSSSDQPLRKMNSQGTDILSVAYVGDSNLHSNDEKTLTSTFNSVAVDEKGFITILDTTWNRLFQYNTEGELLFVFGGRGTQEGTFTEPIDIAAFGDGILVLDKKTGELTKLVPTEFGASIREGSYLFTKGKFEESLEPWRTVLSIDGNYEIANVGIGKVHLMNRDYEKALEFFKSANDATNYSIAYKRYRNVYLRENFNLIVTVIAVLVLAIVLIKVLLKKKSVNFTFNKNLSYAGYCMLHPSDGFGELRYNNKYCYPLSFALIVLYVIVEIIGFFETGFIFNGNLYANFNIFLVAGVPIFLIVSFIFINWLMSDFFEGIGKFNQIFTVVTYSLAPMIISKIIYIILSNVLTSEEGVFLNYINIIGIILFLFILVIGLGAIHMTGFKKNIMLLFTTVLGIVILFFLIFLLVNLFSEFLIFANTLINEISYRVSVGF